MIENLESYRVFYMTARTGSFTKAAETLYITQPAVSHAIKQLETKLGGPLFVRMPKGVRLTAEGEVLYRFIAQAYQLIETGEKKLAEMQALEQGEIRIGAGDTLCRYFLLPYLEQFHRLYPSIRFQVTNRTTQETIGFLKESAIDFGIVNLPLEQHDLMLDIRESMELQDVFVVSPDAPYEVPTGPAPIRMLADYPLIMLERGSSTRSYVDSFAARHGLELQPEIELGSIELLVQFTRIGLGLACVIRNFIEDELLAGTLQEVPLEPPIPPRRVGLVTLRDVPLSSAAQQFMSMLP
ncbi:LysR family transcriptional regulator [Paenibacillus koleovorans]|uniref:LysR family transcriptional regulator n=1 Tax=Paenibacillus koleovorans TaxID=121608 RepID=UPI000FDB8269|nr:LysR family transcriptional regulator [Paenibacillus koleovorans]